MSRLQTYVRFYDKEDSEYLFEIDDKECPSMSKSVKLKPGESGGIIEIDQIPSNIKFIKIVREWD